MAGPPEMRTHTRNRRGERTRSELIEAAWRVVDQMSLVDLFAGVTAQAVADEAGMTTGAFRHHFSEPEQLVRAMVEHHLQTVDWAGLEQVTDEVVRRSIDTSAIRSVVAGIWSFETRPDSAERGRRRLMMGVCGPRTSFPTGDLDDMLVRGFWGPLFEAAGPALAVALESAGRACLPPFEPGDLVRLTRAILDGLLVQSTLDGIEVDAQFSADVLTALLAALTVPVGVDESLDDLEARWTHTLEAPEVTDVDEVRRLAAGAVRLFDRPFEQLTFSRIATGSGTSVELLVATFGTIRRMGAAAFAEVLPRLEESASRHVRRDPVRALADTLCDIARMARQHPHVAAALLFERSERVMASPPGSAGGFDIDVVVPLSAIVAGVIAQIPELSGSAPAELATDLVDLTLLFGGTRTSWAPAEVASQAMSMRSVSPPNEVSSSER